jgi:hypothetical protein
VTSIRWPNEPYAGWSAAREARRERIATAAMQGILAGLYADPSATAIPGQIATSAVEYADALIAKLDKEEGNQ